VRDIPSIDRKVKTHFLKKYINSPYTDDEKKKENRKTNCRSIIIYIQTSRDTSRHPREKNTKYRE